MIDQGPQFCFRLKPTREAQGTLCADMTTARTRRLQVCIYGTCNSHRIVPFMMWVRTPASYSSSFTIIYPTLFLTISTTCKHRIYRTDQNYLQHRRQLSSVPEDLASVPLKLADLHGKNLTKVTMAAVSCPLFLNVSFYRF